jgi:GntR family transcriptional regulator / MocR family aminotransferase
MRPVMRSKTCGRRLAAGASMKLAEPMKTPARTDLLIRVDPRADGTLQQQLYAGIRRAILDGRLAPGTRLPSSRALAADLRVSRTTSLLALEQLLAEGYLSTRQRSGTYVAQELPDDIPRVGRIRPAPSAKHPPLSTRGAALADVPPAARRLAGPPRAFRLGTPAVDLFPVRLWSQLANRRWKSVSAAQLDYGDAPALREAIAAHLPGARGTQCSADQIMIVAGTQTGLDVIARLLLDPGDAVWVEEPGYPGARGALLGAGARVVPVPVDAEGLDVEAGIRVARDARLAYVTPSHQFPLGVQMSLARRLALLKWASHAQAWIIEDDYDSEFRHAKRPIPCLHGLDVDGRVIYVGTFSKTLFPSLRLGFLVVPPDLRDRLVAARRTLDLQPPLLNQAVLADFLTEGHYERHLRRMRSVYRERLEALVSAAERYCSGALRVRPVLTGLHAVADLDQGLSDERVFEEALARGVEATPLSMYFTRATPQNGLMLGFGSVRPDASVDGMQRLAAAIESARRSPSRAVTPREAHAGGQGRRG